MAPYDECNCIVMPLRSSDDKQQKNTINLRKRYEKLRNAYENLRKILGRTYRKILRSFENRPCAYKPTLILFHSLDGATIGRNFAAKTPPKSLLSVL